MQKAGFPPDLPGVPWRIAEAIPALIELFRKLPADPAKYIKSREAMMRARLKGRYKLYLDTSWWVNLRDARFGDSGMDPLRSLLGRLSVLSRRGALLVVPSHISLVELLRQADLRSRYLTAIAID